MPFAEKLYDVGHKLELNRQCSIRHSICEYTRTPSTYARGFDVPFYIGLKHSNIDESGKNQWKWASTDRMLSKDTLGERGDWEGNYKSLDTWKLISWAKGANGKKLRGNCAFVTIDAELWEIQCSSKLTIICEEAFS